MLPALNPNQEARYNRSYEYDAMGDRYARFLIEEILPEVGKKYKISSDPNDRGLAGSSSGGLLRSRRRGRNRMRSDAC